MDWLRHYRDESALTCLTPSILLAVEDSLGDAERLSSYNFPKSEGDMLINEMFVVGNKISITNPYMRMATDRKPMLRVDDFKSIICHKPSIDDINVCRFCLSSPATSFCGHCHKSRYCSVKRKTGRSMITNQFARSNALCRYQSIHPSISQSIACWWVGQHSFDILGFASMFTELIDQSPMHECWRLTKHS